jgi:Replication protein A interacting C-terminal/Replication protein A interacting N-terminal
MGRQPLRKNVTPAAIRDKLRAECLHRVQEQRSALLWRLRNAAAEGQSTQDILESVIDAVVGELDTSLSSNLPAAASVPWPRSPHPQLLATPAATPQPAVAASAAAAVCTGWATPTCGASGANAGCEVQFQTPGALIQQGPGLELGQDASSKGGALRGRDRPGPRWGPEPDYCPNEDVELLLMMERALYEDTLHALVEAAAAAETEELDAMLDTHLGASEPDQLAVPCPVCLQANLVEKSGVIACPGGDLLLDLRAEGLSLEHVRGRLAAAFASHCESGCGATPAFASQIFDRGGPATLLMSCAACGALQVIV